MRTSSFLVTLGMAPLLILSASALPQWLRAQQTGGASAPAGEVGEVSQGPLRPVEVRQRTEAPAQLRLLELQRRQLTEQGQEQVRELEEQEREQIEQLKGEANRLLEQVRRQTKRQIAQVKRQVKWQQELLEAQMKLVEAQAAIQPPPSKEGRPTDQAGGRLGNLAVSPSLEEKLEKILDRLERFEKRLDRLEKAR